MKNKNWKKSLPKSCNLETRKHTPSDWKKSLKNN